MRNQAIALTRSVALPLQNVRPRRILRRYKLGAIGATLMAALLGMAIFGSTIAPYDPLVTDVANRLSGPSSAHWFGTDDLGRDVLSRLLVGSRATVKVSIVAVGTSALVGIPLGLLSGYKGGPIDFAVVYIFNLLLAFPGILLAMTLVGVLGPGTFNIAVAIGVGGIPGFGRLARASGLELREVEFVDAARSVGASDVRILFRHVWPNSTAPLIVSASLAFGFAAFAEAALSFLGIGIQPPNPTWGGMIREGLKFLRTEPYLALFPSIAIFLTIFGASLLGDGLRDGLDPRLRGGD